MTLTSLGSCQLTHSADRWMWGVDRTQHGQGLQDTAWAGVTRHGVDRSDRTQCGRGVAGQGVDGVAGHDVDQGWQDTAWMEGTPHVRSVSESI